MGSTSKKTEDTKPAGNMEFFRLASLVEASLLEVSSVSLGRARAECNFQSSTPRWSAPSRIGRQLYEKAFGKELIDWKEADDWLMQWVKLNPTLRVALQDTGYQKHQKVFTARQVALIFEHLGEP